MNNIDISNPNVPENDQNWIEIVVMAIIYKKVAAVHHFVYILNFWQLNLLSTCSLSYLPLAKL